MPEPMPLGDVLKEHRSKWPKLFSNVEPRESAPEAAPAKSETDFSPAQSRASPSGADSSADAQRSLEDACRELKSKAQPLKPSVDVSKPLADRLFDLFGGGDNAALRRALYQRCQFTVLTFGEPAQVLLREVVEAALRARRPGNYFAFAIVRRFRENGMLQEV